jgi:DNA-binding transcriptional LysR family regulator
LQDTVAASVLSPLTRIEQPTGQTGRPQGTLTFGTPESFCLNRLPPVLKAYRDRWPNWPNWSS